MAQNTFDFSYFWGKLSARLSKTNAGLAEAIDRGAKNRLDPYGACGYSSQGAAFPIVVGGVTFTLNSDGTISTSGRSTSSSAPRVLRIPVTLPAATYHFSGCPANGSSSSYRIDLREPGTDTFITQTMDEGNGINVTFSATTSLDVCLRIAANYDTNAVFSPMVCTKPEWDISNAFVPYAPTNRELYAMIKASQS